MSRLRRRLVERRHPQLRGGGRLRRRRDAVPFLFAALPSCMFGLSRWYFALLGAAFGYMIPGSGWAG